MLSGYECFQSHLFLALPVHHSENVSSAAACEADHHQRAVALLQAAHVRDCFQKRRGRMEAKCLVWQALTNLHYKHIWWPFQTT